MSDSICLQCRYKAVCETGQTQPNDHCAINGCSRFKRMKTQTNYDSIISKTPEELAKYLFDVEVVADADVLGNVDSWLDWLKQEATE